MKTITHTANKKTKSPSFYTRLSLIALSSLIVSSCASMKGNEIHEAGITIYDPMEEQNRQVMAFNMAVDKAIINPVVEGYRTVTPRPARSGIRNFLRNLRSPITLANQILQGDVSGACNVMLRVTINTSIGLGGLFDVAGYEGIEYEPEDFGQTLAVWGVEHGPYMVVPFIGPSSLRDYGGYFADTFADPLRWHLFNTNQELLYTGKYVVDYLDIRDSLKDTLDDLESNSIDYYAAIRSTYYQHRKALVNDQKGTAQSDIPAIPYYEDE
ncbi:MAG: vacJ like lipofamily protein [Alphaproteobacteria bacterium]|nr:MAG: vacJ like lipofamily protein [Alphaproteobacteria bacterium]